MEAGVGEDLLEWNKEEEEALSTRVWVESKKLWRVGGPAILIRLSSFGTLVVTQSFMGYDGETELASYALVLALFVRFANGLLLGMGSATETLCGQAFGAKYYHTMGIHLQRSWIVLSVTATLLLPFFLLATPIFRVLGQDEDLSTVSGPIALWFIPIVYSYVFYVTMQMYLQAQLKNVIIAWLACASFVLHVLASWILVVKLNWGVAGAMGSMALSSWLPIIGEFVYIFCGWCPETWTGFSLSAFSELLPMVKLSISSGIMLWLACPSLTYSLLINMAHLEVLRAYNAVNKELALYLSCERMIDLLSRCRQLDLYMEHSEFLHSSACIDLEAAIVRSNGRFVQRKENPSFAQKIQPLSLHKMSGHPTLFFFLNVCCSLQVWYNSTLVLLAGFMENAKIAIAAFSICLNITTWELMISLGFLTATSVRVSNELGMGNAKGAKFAIKVAVLNSSIIGLFFFALFLVFGKGISYAFTSSKDVVESVSSLSVLLAISVLPNTIQPILSGILSTTNFLV